MTSRLILAALLSVLARILCGPAQASSDYQCDPGWSLDFAALPECANLAALLPGNDTRADLALLLADRNRSPASATPTKQPLLVWHDFRAFFSNPAPTDAGAYASGEGSRCRSDAAGAKAFSAAVEAATNLSPEERVSLISARGSLMPQCEGANAPPAAESPAVLTSTEGRAFAAYLHAARAFYAGQPAVLEARRPAVPHVIGPALWLVVRAETLSWPPQVFVQLLRALRDWRTAGNRVEGFEVDFDARTRGLAGYAAFLRDLRARLPKDVKLGVTGLLDWGANGDRAGLEALAGTVDEVVLQIYQGRHVIPGYPAYLARLRNLRVPFRIGILEGGEWEPPPTLASSPLYRGTVVFLRNDARR